MSKKALDSLFGSLDSTNINQTIINKVEELPMPSDAPKESLERLKPDDTANNSNGQLNSSDAVQETPKPIKKETAIDNHADLARTKIHLVTN